MSQVDDFLNGKSQPSEIDSFLGTQPVKPASALRKLGDLGVGFASGAVGATKAIANAAGAGNKAAQVLGSLNDGINDYLSDEAKADQKKQGQIIADASGKGTWEGIKAGAEAFAVAPVQTAVQGLGSVVPLVAGTALTGGALPAAAVGAGLGVAMGAGTAKGAIYDEIKKRGGTEEQAVKAQQYGGENTDQIALGGVLGAADALTGVSKAATSMMRGAIGKEVAQQAAQGAGSGILARTAKGVLGEVPLEAAQGGQEQVAANIAAQRAGYEAGTWDNVASNATMEALASAGPGGAFGALGGSTQARDTAKPGEVPPVAPPEPAGQLGYSPDPLISFPDGTVGRQEDVDAYVAKLPEREQMSARARLMGLAPQPATPAAEVAPVVPPSVQMGINPAAGVISAVAAQAVDSGQTQEIQLSQAAEQDQAAYEQAMAEQEQQAAEQDTADKPITSGPIADAQLSEEDKRAILFSNEAVADGGRQYEGTINGDILNGMGQPFATRYGAARRANLEGKDWTIAPVFDGWVARRKDAINGATDGVRGTDTGRSEQGGDQPAPSMGLGATADIGSGSDAEGRGADAVGEPRQSAGGADDKAVVSETNQALAPVESAQAATETIANVQDTTPEPAGTQAEAAPVEAGAPAPSDAAPAEAVPGAGAAPVESAGVEQPKKPKYASKEDVEHLFGVDKKRTKALDRIAKGTAYFGTNLKAAQFINENGLKDTHEWVKTGASRFEVREKATTQEALQVPSERETRIASALANGGHVVGADLRDRTGMRLMGLTPEELKTIPADKVRAKPSAEAARTNSTTKGNEDGTQAPQTQQAEAQQPQERTPGQPVAESLPPTDIKVGDTVLVDGKPYKVSQGIQGGIAVEPEPVGHGSGVSNTTTKFLKGDDAIRAKIEADKAGLNEQLKPDDKPNLKKTQAKRKAAIEAVEAEEAKTQAAARADYFTPGNIVKSYGGHDEVLAYNAPTSLGGGWSVRVHAVEQRDGKWVRQGRPQDAREHSTQPEPRNLAAGPVVRLPYQPAAEVQYSEARGYAGGFTHPNAVDRGTKPTGEVLSSAQYQMRHTGARAHASGRRRVPPSYFAASSQKEWLAGWDAANAAAPVAEAKQDAPVAPKPEIVVDKAEMRPYRKPGGSVGYEAVPISEEKTPQATADKAQAATETVAKPDAKAALSEREKAAKAKMFNALGKLATLAGKNTRMNWTQEEEQQLLPIVIELFDGAMELGAVSFQQAVAYVRDFISTNLDSETADAIPFDTLQGAYISVAGRHKDKAVTSKKEVVSFESLAELGTPELEKPADIADTGTEEAQNEPTNTGEQDSQALDRVPTPEGGGAESSGRVGRGGARRGTRGKSDDSGLAEPRVSGTRSGGSGSTSVRAPAARKSRRGRLGDTGTGTDGIQLPEERGSVPVDLFNAPTESVSAGNIQATNFRITEDVRLGQGGETEKFRDNLAAIRTLKAIESEGRRATGEEQRVLSRYVGWGGLASAFPNPETKEWRKEWEARGNELRELLSDKEYDLARRSTLDSHYTSQTVVSAMWSAARRLGFKGGLVAETSMGIGNFMGLVPEDLAGNAKFVGVEYDSLTARMAALLYPQSTVLHSGFQNVPLADNSFDLNIGNPPFGDQSLRFQFKPEINRVSIHNQFFLAGVDALKPGGLQINVVSRYLLDAMDKTTRTMLAKKAKLVAAIRLPDTAFKENARTSVVTDIVVLQRLTPGEEANMAAVFEAAASKPEKQHDKEQERKALAAQVPAWVEVTKVPDPLGGEAMTVNSYFAANPGNILGTLERSGSSRFKNDMTVRPGNTDLSELLAQAVARLPEGVADTAPDAVQASIERHASMSDALRIALSGQEAGSIAVTLDGGLEQVYERETPEGDYELAKRPITAQSPWSEALFQDASGKWFTIEPVLDDKGNPVKQLKKDKATGQMVPSNLNVYDRKVFASEAEIPEGMRLGEAKYGRLVKMVKLRDLMVNQINLETQDAPQVRMEGNRTKLREAYNAFVAEEGFISKPANSALVANMPDGALVQALELSYRKAISLVQAKRMGEKARPEQADPAPILTERVIPKYEPPTKAASGADALSIVMSETGRVDIARMASLLGKTEAEVTAEMFDQAEKPLIFKDPESQEWVTRNDYLTGQVKKKLHAAQAAGLEKHVRELEAVQPEPWGAENVTVLLGANFVPPRIYADFIQHMTGAPAKVSYSQATNGFAVKAERATQAKLDEWGVEGISIGEMIAALMNSTVIKVTYTDGEGNTVVDRERTDLALLKARQIAAEFTDWAFADGERRKTLVNLFNEKYNTRVNRQHDGSHLTLPGKVPDAIIRMRRHQKNAIWRGISERFMLLDHVVGAGKTFTAIARAMERRRMGLSRKPAIIVPNHMVEQFTSDVYRLYPGAKVLAAGKKDFEKSRRRKVFAKIASGDWDVVIIPHSSFGFIGIAPETEQRYLEQELAIAEQAIKDAWDESDESEGSFRKPFNVKQAERLRDKITAKLEGIKGNAQKDKLLTFEQMGIDDLTVDEAHEFKNLFYSSRLTNVKGMGNPSGSQKAFDLYSKVRVLRETPTGTVTFMTGTPISNSAVEMFTMMRYLAADELRELGLEHFDAWRSQFVSTDSGWEPNETGRLKEVNRLGRSWSNMRSLMDLYYSFTDSVGNEDIKKAYAEDNAGKAFPIPRVKGGDRQSVVVQPTPEQIKLLTDTMNEFDALPGIEDPYERNIARLKLMDRARKLSLDVRASVPGHPSKEVGGKLDRISDEVKRVYDKWTDDKGTQLIFLDRSVPKSKGDDKIIKEYDKLVAERNEAIKSEDEEALRKVSEKLDKFDSNEVEELRASQAGGWNAYQQIKDNLIARGIPAAEIRFIQEATNDAQKQALFDQVKAGEVRVLIGSTPRMGAGTNVQDRLVAVHHADVTWKPSDIEQREGRIIRQGNKLLDKYGMDAFEVEILAYATERTIDAKMWNLNSAKLKTINAIRNYDGSFSMDFDDDDSVSMAELAALASGNPLLLERVKLDSDINNLELMLKQHQRKAWGYTSSLEDAESALKNGKPRSARFNELADQADAGQQELTDDLAARSVTVEGQTFAKYADAAKAVQASIAEQQAGDEKAKFSVKVGERRLTSQNGALEAISDAIGDQFPFLATANGQTYRGRTALMREVARLASDAAPNLVVGESKVLASGKMLGFTFEASLSRSPYGGEYTVDLALVDANGKTVDAVDGRSQSETKFVTSSLTRPLERLENTVSAERFRSNARGALQDMERAEREIPTLREKAAMPFAKAEELKEKRARLAQVITELSTDKAPAAPEAAPEDDAPALSRTRPTFSRGAQVQANESVETVAMAIASKWENTPEIIVAFDMNDPIIPEAVRKEDQRQRSGGATGTPEGFYYKGQVYLMSSKLGTANDIARVLFHETLGHYGLRSHFGKEMGTILRDVATLRRAEVDAKIKQYGLKGINLSDRLVAAEEVLAELAQTRPEIGFVKRAIAAVRTWLRQNVPGFASLRLSDAELIRNYILPARQFVENGGGPKGGVRVEPTFSRSTDQTKSDSFKRWFGDSKVVDADGKPLVVYHGTIVRPDSDRVKGMGDITSFDRMFTTKFRSPSIDTVGSWFSTNPGQGGAQMYSGNGQGSAIYPVYLSIKNPQVTTFQLMTRRARLLQNGKDDGRMIGAEEVAAYRKWLNDTGKDGIKIEGSGNDNSTEFDNQVAWIALEPEQIKSATGNNGDFDPENADIRFSRTLGETLSTAANNIHDVSLPAGYTVGDFFKSAPGKLSWWHKTVGTMYDLAQRSPEFKRVFDGVQNFINDVSYYATEAADLAPNILPKLESWKDITKSPLSPEDTKAISAPIFEGTLTWARDESGKPIEVATLEAQAKSLTPEQKAQRLLRNDKVDANVLKMWQGLPIEQYETIIEGKYEREMLKAGIVWTPAELRAKFNLTGEKQSDGTWDGQIGLYQEFRKATDKSLTNLAISDMLRFGGKDTAPIRERVLAAANVVQAGDMLRDYLMKLSDTNLDRKDVLLDTANKMVEKSEKAKDLIERGYAPLSRYGQYTLDVVSQDGERVYFGMFESKMDASRMARRLEQEYPGATMTRGTVSEEEYKLFAGVSPETLELFGDMLGLEAQGDGAAAKAFQTYLKLAKSNRSSMKRMIQRKGIAGFSEDSGRVLAGFVYSNARQTASNLHMGEMTEAASEVSKTQGELKDQAVRLVDYVKNPREEWQAFRGLLFAQYIGGSIASAMVNMTQPITMTFPWLAQHGKGLDGIKDAAKQMTTAMRDANKKLTGDARLDAALKRAEEDGTVSPQEVHQLQQQSQGRGALQSGDGTRAGNALAAGNNFLSRVSLGWGKLFGLAEQFNRRATFIAAYRMAVANGMKDPDAFARKAIAETQGVYNKGNKPAWARGAVGSTLFVFKQYSIAYMEMLHRMYKSGPEGKKAALLALAVLFLMSGAGGLPGSDDLDDLISGLLQRLGYNFDTKAKRKEFFASMVGEGGAQFLETGISGLPGMPLDVSGRLGMGNLIPGTGVFQKKADYTRDVTEIAGPAGDFVKRGFDAAGKVIAGDVLGLNGAVRTIAPKAVQNLYQSYDMASMGMYRDAKGMKVLDTDGYDATLKAIGFQPNDVKKVQDASFEAQRMIGLNRLRESEIANRWALGIFEKDSDKVRAAREELREWNETNADSPIKINFSQILQRVKAMQLSKVDRIAKTAPKEIKATVKASLIQQANE